MSYKRQIYLSIPQSDMPSWYLIQNNSPFRFCKTEQSQIGKKENDFILRNNNYLTIENNSKKKFNKIKSYIYKKKKVIFNDEVEVFDIEKWKNYNAKNTSTIRHEFIPKNKRIYKFISNTPQINYKKRLNIKDNNIKKTRIITHKNLYMRNPNYSESNILHKQQIENNTNLYSQSSNENNSNKNFFINKSNPNYSTIIKNEGAPKCACIVF